MRKLHTRLPIILILTVLLSASSGAVAGASSRVGAKLLGGLQVGGGHRVASTFSGEPDMPGFRGGDGKATPGSSRGLLFSEMGGGSTWGIWIRLLQARMFEQ